MIERITKTLPGVIWNVEVDATGTHLAMEVRNADEKTVSFSIFNLNKAEWLWESVEFEESWWLNLHSVTIDCVYLNYFKEENNPEAKKIIVVDIEQLEVINELDVLKLEERNKLLLLPMHYKDKSKNFEDVADFVKQHNGHIIVNAVDYVQTTNTICISYYLYVEGKLANFLLIIDINGSELINEILEKQLEKAGMHTFFIVNDKLITFKNRNELIIFKL